MTRTLKLDWYGPAEALKDIQEDEYTKKEMLSDVLDKASTGKTGGSERYCIGDFTVELSWSLGDCKMEKPRRTKHQVTPQPSRLTTRGTGEASS